MWPFEKRSRDKNALEKHSRWLRRWFLNSIPGWLSKSGSAKTA